MASQAFRVGPLFGTPWTARACVERVPHVAAAVRCAAPRVRSGGLPAAGRAPDPLAALPLIVACIGEPRLPRENEGEWRNDEHESKIAPRRVEAKIDRV